MMRPPWPLWLLVLALPSQLAAQVIDFETLPDGTPTEDLQEICDQYAALGVTFSLLDRTTGDPVGCPLIAKTGDPKTAFSGCTGSDLPRPGQGTGTSMLTDGTGLGVDADLLVTYTTPVSQCAGIIIDPDCRTNGQPPCEQWTVTALDTEGDTLATAVIDAPTGPSSPECVDPAAGPGDAIAFDWSFDLPGQQIAAVRIVYTGNAGNVGLAFDNFSPSVVPPLTVSAKGPRYAICAGHEIELYADTRGGLPPRAVQWQQETAPGVWADLGTAPSEIVAPGTTSSYRAVVTDGAGSMAQGPVTVEVVSGAGNAVCDTRLLVSSAHNDRVLRYDPVSRSFVDTFVAAGSGGLDGPAKLAFARDGSLLVNSQSTNQVLRYDGTSGAFLGVLVPSVPNGPSVPVGLEIGPDGDVYVANVGTNDVRRYDSTTGAYLGAFVTPGAGGLNQPTGIEFGDDGYFYVASRTGNDIKRYDSTTGAYVDDFTPAGSGLGLPRGLAFHPRPGGDLFVGSESNDSVEWFDGDSGLPKGPLVPPGRGTLDRANDLAYGPEGNLYVASLDNDKVLIFGEHTGVFLGELPSGNGLDGPAWLTFTLYCGDGICDPTGGETPCGCAGDCGMPAADELVCDDGLDEDCDGAVDCEDADCAAETACAGAGSVPVDALLPGTPLRIERGLEGALELTWGASCNAGDTDFAVYEGQLGLPGSHTPRTCGTGGTATWTLDTPGAGNRYYIVVPLNAAFEGSHGRDSGGAERPQGVFPCRAQSVTCP
jgi:WD40 repeat protein